MINRARSSAAPHRGRAEILAALLPALALGMAVAIAGCGGRGSVSAAGPTALAASISDSWGDDQDHHLAVQIRQAIDADRTIGPQAKRIAIAVRSQRVWLTGTVDSTVVKAQAGVVASWLAGMDRVADELQVNGSEAMQ